MVTSRIISFVFLCFLFFSTAHAQNPLIQQVLDQEALRFNTMIQADTAALRPMLADDLVYVHSNALTENKASHLAAIGSHKLVYQKMLREKAEVRLYGKIALVNGAVKVNGIINDTAFDIHLTYLAVYQKKKGGWQLLSWQSTKMP